jgi:hypothetical protein
MVTKDKPPTDKAKATMPDVATVQPKPWELNTEFGFMRSDPTNEGRLVRLADVLRWIEESQQIPRKEAIQVLCDAMPEDITKWLYWVKPDEYAEIIKNDYLFGYETEEQVKEQKIRFDKAARSRHDFRDCNGSKIEKSYELSISEKENTSMPGLPALIKAINKEWYKTIVIFGVGRIDNIDNPCLPQLTNLSISLDKAESVFEYKFSRVSFDNRPLLSWEELVAERKSLGKGAAWTERQGFSLVAELRRGTQQNSMAIDLGCSDPYISQLKKEWTNRYDEYLKLLALSNS